MVEEYEDLMRFGFWFQYSLCRVVLMVSERIAPHRSSTFVSVLALSSRFDGQALRSSGSSCYQVSVLALSSRFDGPEGRIMAIRYQKFQYSLCRVVLMVEPHASYCQINFRFQYSLCRVVLMVLGCCFAVRMCWCVSVLALSSRFDGHSMPAVDYANWHVSVLALSSRFDGHVVLPTYHVPQLDVSVLALSSRFDGQIAVLHGSDGHGSFSTRSVESF